MGGVEANSLEFLWHEITVHLADQLHLTHAKHPVTSLGAKQERHQVPICKDALMNFTNVVIEEDAAPKW